MAVEYQVFRFDGTDLAVIACKNPATGEVWIEIETPGDDDEILPVVDIRKLLTGFRMKIEAANG